jgi:hypothetical protein
MAGAFYIPSSASGQTSDAAMLDGALNGPIKML